MIDQARERIKKGLQLHHGAVAEVVRQTVTLRDGGYSYYHVQRVLKGESHNTAILELAGKILARYEQTERARESRINQLAMELA